MDILQQLNKIIIELADIDRREIPFEDQFRNVLSILMRETGSDCGCICSEFEHVNKITVGCKKPEQCPCERRDSSENDKIVYSMADADETIGELIFCGLARKNRSLEIIELIRTALMPLIVKTYKERRQNLLMKYSTLEKDISNQVRLEEDIKSICRNISGSVNLHSLSLALYDTRSSSIDVIAHESHFPASVNKLLSNLHLNLKNNSSLRSWLESTKKSEVLPVDRISTILEEADDISIEQIERTLSDLSIKELFIVPSAEFSNGRYLFLIANKQAPRMFPQSQITLFDNIMRLLPNSVENSASQKAGIHKAQITELSQNISRRIIEDSEIEPETERIRQELKLHSCVIFLYNRLENTYYVEGISSSAPKSDVRVFQSITIKPESLQAAGYSKSDLNQLRFTTLNEYAESIEYGNNQETTVSTILKKYGSYNVIQVPLFDSFRRLQGFAILVRKSEQQFLTFETELIKDMTSRMANAFEIRTNIYNDSLTGLPNIKKMRPIIIDKLISSEPFSLILCKIVNLKEIVITRGDEVVDNSIIAITKRITQFVTAQSKKCIVSRNSGEASFVFVYPNTNEKKIRSFSKGLIDCITKPIRISGNTINLVLNIGICNSTDIWDSDMIFNYSKLAIQSLADQKNAVCIFDAKMQRAYSYDKELEDQIRASISNKQFLSHYQPKVSCNGTICGYEALVRWSRQDTIEYPNVFIDKIEKMGMIQDLFDIVLENICRDFAASRTVDNVSINISPLQLANKNLPSRIVSCISAYDIDPSRITFELVETAIVNPEYHSTITKLKKIGFKLSLDDFGTGYARYQTLITLFDQGLISELKIDKVFIDNITSPAYQSFISSISNLARDFNISVVIEGVETPGQYTLLKTLNPDVIIQGWLVSKAIPLDKVKQLSEKEVRQRLSRKDV